MHGQEQAADLRHVQRTKGLGYNNVSQDLGAIDICCSLVAAECAALRSSS